MDGYSGTVLYTFPSHIHHRVKLISHYFRDDDMQSIASLMSIGSSRDIGNLDDVDDLEDEDADTASIRTETTMQISDLASMCEELERSHDKMSPLNTSSSQLLSLLSLTTVHMQKAIDEKSYI